MALPFYAEAVERKVRLVQYLRNYALAHISNDDPQKRHHEMMLLQAAYLPARYGETYWVAADIWNAITVSAPSMPGTLTLLPDLPPTEHGFVWLEKPWRGLGYDVPAVSWCMNITKDGESNGMILTAYRPLGRDIVPAVHSYLRFGESLVTTEGRMHLDFTNNGWPDEYPAASQLSRIGLAFFLWLQQKILVAHAQPLERAAARRLRSTELENLGLRVVTLRRTAHPHEAHDAHETAWTCQWIVGGHWRSQFYPASQVHRAIWILPHVKGPTDKPLKVPGDTIFKVSR